MVASNLKKGILLIGKSNKRSIGKSRIAEIIMNGKKSATFNGRNKNLLIYDFTFSICDKKTEIIFIDDLLDFENQLSFFFNAVTKGIIVEKQYSDSFIIYPQIIISINCKMKDLPVNLRLENLFDIFQLSACNQNYIPLND